MNVWKMGCIAPFESFRLVWDEIYIIMATTNKIISNYAPHPRPLLTPDQESAINYTTCIRFVDNQSLFAILPTKPTGPRVGMQVTFILQLMSLVVNYIAPTVIFQGERGDEFWGSIIISKMFTTVWTDVRVGLFSDIEFVLRNRSIFISFFLPCMCFLSFPASFLLHFHCAHRWKLAWKWKEPHTGKKEWSEYATIVEHTLYVWLFYYIDMIMICGQGGSMQKEKETKE